MIDNNKFNINLNNTMVSDAEKKIVEDLYDCEENPISYMIEPKGSIKFTESSDKITKEDFKKILN